MKNLLAVVVAAWLALSGVPLAAAEAVKNNPTAIIELQHTAWTARDGLPPNINNIVQTADGWLWLGSDDGLYRFDGAKSELYQPRSGNFPSEGIMAMGRLPDDRLWVSFSRGGIAILRDGVLTSYTSADGLSRAPVYRLVAEPNGRLWAASSAGIHQLEPGEQRWHAANGPLGLTPRFLALDLLRDRRGTFWMLSTAGLFSLPAGATEFSKVGERHAAGRLAETPDGRVWASAVGVHGLQLLYSPPELRTPIPDTTAANGVKFMFDRDGNLWLPGTDGVRQLTFEDGKATQHQLNTEQGLTGADVSAYLQDREGNIWIATDGGLDQFRPRRVRQLQVPPIQTFGAPLLAGRQGDVWIDQFYYPALGAKPVPYGPGSTDATLVTVLYRDPHGQLWSAARDGLWQINGSQRVPIPPPILHGKHRLIVILDMVMDTDGGLWVSFAGSGVYRLKDGAWTALGGIPELDKAIVLNMTIDPSGRLWFSAIGNTVFKLEGGKAVKLGAKEGLLPGDVDALTPYRNGLLVGGHRGLMWFDGKVFRPLKGAGGMRFAGIRGLLVAPDGRLWINSSQGLQGIDASEMARALAQPDYAMRVLQFDFNDGARGVSAGESSKPRLTRLSSGELLFATPSGVYWLDPAHYPTNPAPPPVYITAVSADNAARPSQPEMRLPASPQNLRIDYTALSLTLPQRVQFRYMLEGVDTQWQDAGNRRSAYYTTLAPGSYRFRVMAANEDGVWNTSGASIMLVVPPTLVQTVWFKLLCVAALALLVWLAHRLRLREVLRRMQRSFEVRVAERERIARELHDTLLQSVQGLMLTFDSIAARMPPGASSRPMMERALKLAEEVMVEGRDKVGDLRQAGPGRNLAEALASYGHRRGESESASYALHVEGRIRPLHGAVREEAYAVGREAINNAFLHAQASRIDVTLSYGERYFELNVRDNGRGMAGGACKAPDGHWGVAGMHERAAQMGARLALDTTPGRGTTWTLRVAAPVAYDASPAADTPDMLEQASV